jgi:NAD(P)-dependent dehydrogenase (short-subunit alcohol dehydrogenase family)
LTDLSTSPSGGQNALSHRVVIVTGGARGIGKAIALRCAEAGAAIVIADVEDDLASETVEEIEALGCSAIAVHTDVSDASSVNAMCAQVTERMRRVDVLINNAAMMAQLPPQPFDAIAEEQWDSVMQVNVKGPWLCIRAIVPMMRKQRYGKIVNMSSDMILSGVPGLLHYVASKGALAAMTRALAHELGPDGICINAVAPGFTTTAAAMAHGEEAAERSIRSRALQRAQTPNDITGTVLFLSSADSDFMTGQLVVVNGGAIFH